MGKKRSGGGLSPTQQIAKFLGVSVLAGAVLAGIAMPAAGALGLTAKGTVDEFDDIPANLKRPPLSQRTQILDANGGQIATVYSRDRTVVPLKKISPYMQKAIVAIEDSRFYQHGAIDMKGILRAVNENAQSGGVAQGASTLTQQYVKNVFVEEAGDDPEKVAAATQQTIGRKIRELKFAIQIEDKLGKKGILNNYLNITFFGQQAYGVEAAAQRYFSKSAKDLTLQESALLAGIVQSPSRYDPVNDPQEATKRRNTVLQRMSEVHAISPKEAKEAKAEPLGLKVTKPTSGCITASAGAGFFCDYVEHVFLTDPAFGKTKEERLALWHRGGMTIRTTLDPKAQESVQASLKKHVYQSDSVAAASTLVEPGSGKILAMGQSKPYGYQKNETEMNFSVNHSMGGSNYGFPTGSTFKPFLAAAAIEGGTPPTKSYPAPFEMDYPKTVATCDSKPWVNDSNYHLENENESEHGPYALKDAMAKSVNTYFVQMLGDVGMCPVSKMTDKLGVKQGNDTKLPLSPSALTLGSNGLSPLTMASAYAAFANRGEYCTPIAVGSITGPGGKSMPVPKSTCSRAMSEKTADSVNTLLRGVVDSGTGKQAGLTGRDNAGKTGTTDSRLNAWFVGYTPNMSGAVWVGSANQDVEMQNITIGGVYNKLVFGGAVPGPIWKDAVTGALAGKDAPKFNLIDIPDAKKDKDKGKGKGKGKTQPPADNGGGQNNNGGGGGGGQGDGGGGGGGGQDDNRPGGNNGGGWNNGGNDGGDGGGGGWWD
ncbi:transglycosylase domain-containing protein [Streptomyces tsukubensis]|uniref:Penicillin-binding protein n=1 Tax=Streptomyces tsukubensis TaxID=83656 RepID=A0A1V4ACT0_9ACTN|nr:transglycosylase domain-containing protein [Streptomyces tsukubensis]OON81025.1 penicillin-binding protein [Streptomyces tsukubensis]QFR94863.1 penicillin-binding protein [Streptomyces tsukubensis]